MIRTLHTDIERHPAVLMPDIIYSQQFDYFGKVPRPLKMSMVRPEFWEEIEKLPTIVWVIGGAWKETAPMKWCPEHAYLAHHGFNVVSIDYRVSHEAQYPAQIQDVKTAIRFLRANAEKYGVDENRIGIMGDSAGGYLAAMVGTSAGVEEFETDEWAGYSDEVLAVADLYGPMNLGGLQEEEGYAYGKLQVTPEKLYFGEERASDPDILKRANPMTYISEKTPPFLILHGTEDEQIPVAESERLHEALQAKGVPADLYLIEGAMHATEQFHQPKVEQILLNFFKKHLG